jgi:hypothetical protein
MEVDRCTNVLNLLGHWRLDKPNAAAFVRMVRKVGLKASHRDIAPHEVILRNAKLRAGSCSDQIIGSAHRWWRDLLERHYGTMRELAQAYDTDESYVGRILPLAFLDAGLTPAIIGRGQPLEFTLHRFLYGSVAGQHSVEVRFAPSAASPAH